MLILEIRRKEYEKYRLHGPQCGSNPIGPNEHLYQVVIPALRQTFVVWNA